MGDYLLDLLTQWALFATAATVVAVLAEEAGVIHAGAAAFLGIGAYAAALLSTRYGVAQPVALLGAALAGLVAGNLCHVLLGRFRKDVLALATLAVGVVVHGLMINAEPVTGGVMGIAGVPRYRGLTASASLDATVLLAALIAAIALTRNTTFGKRTRAVRDDEVLAAELELRPGRIRWSLWVASSAVLALVGGMYAFHLRYVDPSSFTVRESVAILAMAVMVPSPRAFGATIGAFVFIALPEALRFLGLPSGTGAEVRQIVFGVALLVVVARSGEGRLGLFARKQRYA